MISLILVVRCVIDGDGAGEISTQDRAEDRGLMQSQVPGRVTTQKKFRSTLDLSSVYRKGRLSSDRKYRLDSIRLSKERPWAYSGACGIGT